MVFVCSMSDLFHPAVPWDFLWCIFITMRDAPHIFQVLTKRPGRMAAFAKNLPYWPSNIWAGVSVETAQYLARLDVLARVPAKVRFVSCEPLLGPLDLRPWLAGPGPAWVIIGGESGPNARPLDLNWVRDILHQCREAGVPVFVKQLGTVWARQNGARDWKGENPQEWPQDLRVREWPRR